MIVHCQWSAWGNYSECSHTCGRGWRLKIRRKTTVEKNGGKCEGKWFKYDPCSAPMKECPGNKHFTCVNYFTLDT